MKKLTARLSGKAYGMFNLRWLHVGSVTVFSIESTVCGAAPNMNALIIGRVIAGAGGAGMYLGLLNLIAINTTARERPAYMGGTGVVCRFEYYMEMGGCFQLLLSLFPTLMVVPGPFT
jgi:MFS family permease